MGRKRTPRTDREPAPGRYLVWDLPTRLSHWAITVLFLAQFLTGHFGWGPVEVHLWLGYALLAVLLFRIQWGLVGSQSARFSRMLAGPRAILEYLPRLSSSAPTRSPGHNPLGGLSALLLLLLLLAQSTTGLFMETWGEFRGPLAERLGRDAILILTDLHDLLRWPILALVTVHILAALYYRLRKSEDRIGPVFTHGRLLLDTEPGLRFFGAARAAWVLGISVAVVGAIILFGPVD